MDLLTQAEGRVAKILGAVEVLATELEADPARVAPEVLSLLWGYGTGDQGPAVQCPCGGTRRPARGARSTTRAAPEISNPVAFLSFGSQEGPGVTLVAYCSLTHSPRAESVKIGRREARPGEG